MDVHEGGGGVSSGEPLPLEVVSTRCFQPMEDGVAEVRGEGKGRRSGEHGRRQQKAHSAGRSPRAEG
jgi:hypothetical protein